MPQTTLVFSAVSMAALFAWVVCEYAWEGWRIYRARCAAREASSGTASEPASPTRAGTAPPSMGPLQPSRSLL